MEQHEIDAAVSRIRHMEACFDTLQQANLSAIREDASFQALLEDLLSYYESGQWLRDYELDENGLLPSDLKRGVLAQDAVFDLLDRIKASE